MGILNRLGVAANRAEYKLVPYYFPGERRAGAEPISINMKGRLARKVLSGTGKALKLCIES
jgi:hypothetical protein